MKIRMLPLVAVYFAIMCSASALDQGDRPADPATLGQDDRTVSTFGDTRVRIGPGSNPDAQKGFSDQTTKNPSGLLVDLGGYGAPSFSGIGIPEAITGAIRIPTDAKLRNHGAGVSGYARSSSPTMGAVGLYGQGDAKGRDTTAWGFNTRTQDNGIKTNGLWGGEIDVNVTAEGTFARGLDIVGGSTASLDPASPGIIIQAPGIGLKGKPKPIRWGRGILLDDESAVTGLEIGTAAFGVAGGSMPIVFMSRTAKNARQESFKIYAGGPDGVLEVSAPNAFLKLRGDVNGIKKDALTIHGDKVGIGSGDEGPPAYPLDVHGGARFAGPVGFGGVTPVARPKLPPPATDAASTMALVNAIRATLIANGLAQ